ncbi:MAG: ATP-binding protein [Candidatus Dormibacteria bacterium]
MPSVVDRIMIRERIDPGITASLFSNYRSSADAVMELVDNALDSRLAGQPMRIDLIVHPTWIVVNAEGGEGMGPPELERNYLRWGGSSKRGRGLLGQYGQGGKAAIGHLGASFTVESSRPGDGRAWRFRDPEYRERTKLKTYELLEVAKRVPAELGYVRIRIDDVDRRLDPRRLGSRLAEAYRPLLESNALAISVNQKALTPPPLTLAERHDFRVRTAGRIIGGWIGVIDTEHRASDFVPGVRCYKLGRLISNGETFGHPSAAQVAGMAQMVGEVDLPPVPLTMNKSDFDRDSAEWVAVEARMHEVLAPLARRLARVGEAPPPVSAIRAAARVRRLLGQALRLLHSSAMFEGEAPGGRGPEKGAKDPLPLIEAVRKKEEAAERQRQPASPPPPGKGSRRGFGDIVVRALTPSVRSQTVVEDGSTVIVINSRYPLFVARGGDELYQLETAVREMCKSGEFANVAEFEGRVNEILLAALSLRKGRRRGAIAGKQMSLG